MGCDYTQFGQLRWLTSSFKALCLLSPRALFTWQKHRHFVIKNRNSAKKKKKNNDTVRVEENKKTYCLDMLDININLYLLDTLDIIFFPNGHKCFLNR